jgi:Ca2+-binding EF-hand superfamily protein
MKTSHPTEKNLLQYVTTVLCSAFYPAMFDRDRSGTIDIHEFQLLYNYINQWLATFRAYDRDGSGQIDESELTQGTGYYHVT